MTFDINFFAPTHALADTASSFVKAEYDQVTDSGSGEVLAESDDNEENNIDDHETQATESGSVTEPVASTGLASIPIDKIIIWEKCIRKESDEKRLIELVGSIKEQGVIQPVRVQLLPDGSYRLIAGYRRYKASIEAKKSHIAAIFVSPDATEAELLLEALVENLHREELTPLQKAEGFDQAMKEAGYNQSQLAQKLGKAENSVSEVLSLLKLPGDIKDQVRDDARYRLGRLIKLVKTPYGQRQEEFAAYQDELGITSESIENARKRGKNSSDAVFKNEKKRHAKLSSTGSLFSQYEKFPETVEDDTDQLSAICRKLLEILGHKEEAIKIFPEQGGHVEILLRGKSESVEASKS